MRPVSVFAALAACLGACAEGSDGPGPRSAILLTLDTTRADALGCYGGPAGLTPNLDRLASEGVLFERAFTVTPLTLPSHASMLTGLIPPRHTVRDNGLVPLPPAARSVAELARERGFQTAAVVSASALDRAFALDQGFELYLDPGSRSSGPMQRYLETSAADVLAAARTWLEERDRERPFLLWLHLFEPHAPYVPPPDALRRAGGDPYLGEIADMDDAVGDLRALLEQTGALDESLLVVLGDHGESRGEHGEPTHGSLCYEASLRIPMLLRFPDGRRAGERSLAAVSAVDVFPTLVQALSLGAPGDVDGLSLFEESPAPGRGVYHESYAGYLNFGWAHLAGWSDGRLKLLVGAETELYDRLDDPGETDNLAAARPEDVARARAALGEMLRAPALSTSGSGEISSDLMRDLRQLGYGATGGVVEDLPHPLEPSARPSPRSRAVELEPFERANEHLGAGRFAEAIAELRVIESQNPDNALALDLLTYALMQVGGCAEAVGLFEHRLTLGPPRSDTLMSLGACLERTGEPLRALAEYRRALEVDESFEPALAGCVRLLESLGRAQEAAPYRARLEALGRGE